MAILQLPASLSLTRFVPETMLPPQDYVSLEMKALASALCKELMDREDDLKLAEPVILDLLRLVLPCGSLAGAASTLANDPSRLVIGKLAQLIALETGQDELIPFLQSVEKALSLPQIVAQFPVIKEVPSKGQNLLLFIHSRVGHCAAYNVLYGGLQIGLLNVLKSAGWARSDEVAKTQAALATAVLRLMPQLPADRLAEALRAGDCSAGASLVWETLVNLGRRRRRRKAEGKVSDPLKPETCRAYFRDFALLVGHAEWLEYESDWGRLGQGTTDADEGDDEQVEARLYEAGKKQFAKVVRRSLRGLAPGSSLFEEEPELSAELPDQTWVLSDERAVLSEYLSPTAWNTCHPNVMAAMLRMICVPNSATAKRNEAVRGLLLALILIGRSSEFLRDIEVGSWPVPGEPLRRPRYVPEGDAIIYAPEVLKRGLPAHPQRDENLFVSTSPYWVLPLPEILIPACRSLAVARQGQPLFAVDRSQLKEALDWLTAKMRKTMPNLPRISEGRLRTACTTLLVTVGKLDFLLSAFISGQWRPAHWAPLFYTTLSAALLAARYRLAVRCTWEFLRGLAPDLPELALSQPRPLPEVWMGSPYRPRLDALQGVFQALQKRLAEATTPETRHNAATLLAMWLLGVLCGLRFSEVINLRAMQVDLHSTWKGVSRPWVILNKTKSNRFTVASRIVVLPAVLVPLLAEILPGDSTSPAFVFWANGQRVSMTPDAVRRCLKALPVPAPHWHSGRHILRSFLVEENMAFDAVNAILGHQAQGREVFNLCLPVEPETAWSAYLELAAQLAHSLGLIA